MNEYIFYVKKETTSSSCKGNDTYNFKVLGRITAANSFLARRILLKKNPWIITSGLKRNEIHCEQLLTEEQRSDIKTVIEYLWRDEKRHFEESEADERSNHIFTNLRHLKQLFRK